MVGCPFANGETIKISKSNSGLMQAIGPFCLFLTKKPQFLFKFGILIVN